MHHDINEKERALEMYNNGLRFNKQNMMGPAIKAFKQCIECKEDNCYKACYELTQIYMKLQDFDAAYKYCVEVMMLKPRHVETLYHIAHILRMMNISIDELKKRIEFFFNDDNLDYSIISHIFYMEGLYETALEYIIKYEEEKELSDSMKLFRVKCLLRLSRYNESMQYINTIPENNLYFFNIMMYKILCLIVTSKYDLIWRILNKFSFSRLSRYNKRVLSAYTQFYNLVLDKETSILCEDENDIDYSSCIFEIYEILLVNKEFDLFEKALGLLNLISDKSVLLQLGKLYFKYGYIQMAKKEIIRSIKYFEVTDSEALDILTYNILPDAQEMSY